MIPSPSSYHIEIWNHLIFIDKKLKRVIYFWKNLKQFLWYEQIFIQISTYVKISGILQCHSFSGSLHEFLHSIWGEIIYSICIYILVLTLYHQYKISTFIHNFYHKKDKTTPKFSLDVLISTLSTFCSKYITGSQE